MGIAVLAHPEMINAVSAIRIFFINPLVGPLAFLSGCDDFPCGLTPWLTGAGSRRLEGTNIGHENGEAMAYVGVRVEPTVRLGSGVEARDGVHSGCADWSGSSSLENTVETAFRA